VRHLDRDDAEAVLERHASHHCHENEYIDPMRAFAVILLAALGCSRTKSDPSPAQPAMNPAEKPRPGELVTGDAAKGDFTTDAPGVRRKLTPADLPPPGATDSADNGPRVVDRPDGAAPRVPAGFAVDVFASGLTNPRNVRVAPNGDVFVVESRPNRVVVLSNGKKEVFATGLNEPFGLAFREGFVYVANTDAVVRFAYQDGDLKARGTAEKIVDLSGGGKLRGGGHWTRDVVFSKDGSKMFVSVGSFSNVSDDEREGRRARIFEYTPDGKNERVFATGIRNPVGLAVHPDTGELWTSVNERDELGDHLVPDYVTRVKDGGFYGWPWFYIGGNEDPRHAGKHPELKAKVIVPDVLLQSHSASLGMTFHSGTKLPVEWRGGAFAAEHGSWNRARRTGYKVIYVPAKDGVPTGEYVDFMTGFVANEREVWGRPTSVAVAKDGALLVSDDGGNCVWRVSYSPASAP
jgi:glucose/arabinose dehydrogenase